MTTYPLSEPATVYFDEHDAEASSGEGCRGTLEECSDLVAAMTSGRQKSAWIRMDDMDLQFGPQEVAELLRHLRDEGAGLSNVEIAEIKNPDGRPTA